jgi:DNA invertase Pin-like site-specific DNA recombinase
VTFGKITALAADDGDGHPFAQLGRIAELRAELDRLEAATVRRARNAGMSWQLIATALGVSKQAVHKKYGRR